MPAAATAATALASRAVLLALCVAFSQLIPPYDTSAHLAHARDCGAAEPPPLLTYAANWDGLHFLEIAAHGYEYEHAFAFFPLYPALVRAAAGLLPASLCPRTALVVAAWLLSNAAFVLAAVLLEALTAEVTGSLATARRAAMLFCWNPASVFMGVAYTESAFCLATFAGMLLWTRGRRLSGALCFALGAAMRSNGGLAIAFVAHHVVSHVRSVRAWLAGACYAALIAAPSVLHQLHAFSELCAPPGPRRPWCDGAILPNVYGFVQSEYWGVGFLRYFTPAQAPNFALAAPMLAIAYTAVWTAKGQAWARAPFVLWMAVLAATGTFVGHVQVSTRLLATCPAVYWWVAEHGGAWHRVYFCVYFVLGAALFSTFYPWT